jgi:hypothetical protein
VYHRSGSTRAVRSPRRSSTPARCR